MAARRVTKKRGKLHLHRAVDPGPSRVSAHVMSVEPEQGGMIECRQHVRQQRTAVAEQQLHARIPAKRRLAVS